MPYIVNYDDITAFHTASGTQIYTWNENLADIQEKLISFTEMDSFKGNSADHVKDYITEVHGSVMISMSEILAEFQSRFLLYKDGFYSEVDDDLHSLITEEALTDWKNTVNASYDDFLDIVELTSNTASKVNDLVSGVPVSAMVESGYATTNTRIQTILDNTGNHENAHLQSDFTNLQSLIDSLTAFCNEMLENKASDLRNYQAGSIANLPSYQVLSNTVTDAFNARLELEQELTKASENESVRQEALAAEERVEQGWVKMATSALIVVGGAVCIIATAGLATPLVVAGAVAGVATIAYGAAEMQEASYSIELGLAGDGHTVAYNPLRDTLFQGNQTAYNIFGGIAIATSTVLTMGAGGINAFSAAKTAGTSVSRAVAVYSGKVIVSAGAGIGSGYAGTQLGHALGWSDAQSQLFGIGAGLLGGAITGWGLNRVDQTYNVSGYYNKQTVADPDFLLDKNGSKSDGGNIDWKKWVDGDGNGFALDADGNPMSAIDSPTKGKQYDRFGPSEGRFTSPVENGNRYSYGERALPYGENPYARNTYEVTRNFSELPDAINALPNGELKESISYIADTYYGGDMNAALTTNTGTIAPGFNQPGGGIQTKFPLAVDTLIELGFLKDVTAVPLLPNLAPAINWGAVEGATSEGE